VIGISGEDRLDWLHRQSSNDLRPLRSGGCLATVLTSPTARVLDVLHLLDTGDDLLAVTMPGRAGATFTYLRRRIFFRDRVRVDDQSQAWVACDLWDSEALAMMGCPVPQPGTFSQNADGLIAFWVADPQPTRIRLLAPADRWDALRQRLPAPISAEQAEVLRVKHGLPRVDREITEEYTPLEISLAHLVSTDKGCYPGQEVLARQINYDKIARRMVGLRADQMLTAGATVRVAGTPIGKVTSTAQSPQLGPLALAVVRRPHHTPGTQVEVNDIPAIVTTLPF